MLSKRFPKSKRTRSSYSSANAARRRITQRGIWDRTSNNIAENALRIVALGRKNFLFVGNEDAGRNLATLQTIVATCNANGVNPKAYIKNILIRVQNTPSSEIDSLLPQNWKEAV